jgi:hypothetical protein
MHMKLVMKSGISMTFSKTRELFSRGMISRNLSTSLSGILAELLPTPT